MKVYKFNDYHKDNRILENLSDQDGFISSNMNELREYLNDLKVLKGDISYKVEYSTEIDGKIISGRYLPLDCKNCVLTYNISIIFKTNESESDFECIKHLQNLGKLCQEVEIMYGHIKREKIFSKYKVTLEAESSVVFSHKSDYIINIYLEKEDFLTPDEMVELSGAWLENFERMLDEESKKINHLGYELIYNEDEIDEDFVTIGLSNDEEGLLDMVGGYKDGVISIDWDEVETIINNYEN